MAVSERYSPYQKILLLQFQALRALCKGKAVVNTNNHESMITRILAYLIVILISTCATGQASGKVMPGYTIHFNFVSSREDARKWVDKAAAAGSRVLSLVPPAHIWEDPAGTGCLDAAIDEARRLGIKVIFSRMDACHSDGSEWLFSNVLNEPARLPGGLPTAVEFCATVGNRSFEKWQHDETLYYSRKYGKLANLLACAVGGMVEPLVSQRGSLAVWDERTECYEIAQYSRQGLEEWHRWLENRFHNIEAVNGEYGTGFESFSEVPMPVNGGDRRFVHSREAYFDLVTSMNDWFLRQYGENRSIWMRYSSVPFVLQLNGGAAEKIALGQPEFAAFDLPGWLSEADAVGLSLYTYSGYSDWGHGHNFATIQLLEGARELGKRAFIMECGCEAPEVTVTPHELSFATRMGLLLRPETYVYEYFVYRRDGQVQPGMMISPSGVLNEPGYTAVSRALERLTSFEAPRSSPCFFYLTAPLTARRSVLAGKLNCTVYRLADYLPCRMYPLASRDRIPRGAVVLLPPELEKVLTPGELKSLAFSAGSKDWQLAGTPQTCEAVNTSAGSTGAALNLNPLAIESLLSGACIDDKAAILREELGRIPAFCRLLNGQPFEPRPGLHWLDCGKRIFLWVEDTAPVICHYDAVKKDRTRFLWCSVRGGKSAEIVFQSAAMRGIHRILSPGEWHRLAEPMI